MLNISKQLVSTIVINEDRFSDFNGMHFYCVFKNILFYIFENRVTEIACSSTGLLLKRLQQPGLVQAKARTLEIHLGPHLDIRGVDPWATLQCLPGHITCQVSDSGLVPLLREGMPASHILA